MRHSELPLFWRVFVVALLFAIVTIIAIVWGRIVYSLPMGWVYAVLVAFAVLIVWGFWYERRHHLRHGRDKLTERRPGER